MTAAVKKCSRCPRTDIRARGLCGACYQSYRYRQKAYGKFQPTYVDAAPAKSHLIALREAGMGYINVSNLSGLPRKTVATLKTRGKCHRDVSAAILAVPLPGSHDLHLDFTNVSSLGSARRLQALTAIGWTSEDLAPYCGIRADIIRRIRGGRQTYVLAKTARTIDKVFQQLQMTRGPAKASTWTVKFAERRGWAPPLAWDEESIDDPGATPSNPKDSADAWYEDYLELKSLGKPLDQIAERMGMSQEALTTRLRRRKKNASTGSNQEHE